MNSDVELFADTLLVMIVMFISITLMKADPLFPLTWGAGTFLMSSLRK